MFRSPQKAANVKIKTLTILLQEKDDLLIAALRLLEKSNKADEAMEKFGHLEPLTKSALKTGTER